MLPGTLGRQGYGLTPAKFWVRSHLRQFRSLAVRAFVNNRTTDLSNYRTVFPVAAAAPSPAARPVAHAH